MCCCLAELCGNLFQETAAEFTWDRQYIEVTGSVFSYSELNLKFYLENFLKLF